MIRNVVLGRVRAEAADPASPAGTELDAALTGIATLELPGQLAVHVGRDAGLRAGGWSFAITNDWADAESYHRYDADPEHNVHRTRIVALCEQVARVQFEIADAPPAT